MTATFQVPNQTVDNPGVYFPKNDGNWALAQAIIAAFACHEAATPNMTVLCDAGSISFAGQLPTLVSQQTITGFMAPVGNPRIDLIVIDSNTGVASKVTGTVAASPVDPAVPNGAIPVARITFATSTAAITNALITDLRSPSMASQAATSTLGLSANTTLTQKQAGIDMFCSGAGVTITLPSPSGCTGAKFRFMGTDANTQTLSGSFVYPDGATSSAHSLVNYETLDVESNGSVWRVVNRQGGGSGRLSGEMVQYGGTVAPAGWMLCAGAALSTTTYANLFAVIGYTYGGAGASFNLPDGRGRTFVGAGTGTGLTARSVGQAGGEEAHLLTAAELAAHSHGITDPGHGHTGSTDNPGNHTHTVSEYVGGGANANSAFTFVSSTDQYITNPTSPTGAAGGHTHALSVNSNGTGISVNATAAGGAHNNMQPFLVGNWIIKT